ncbi:MAG: TolC family protein [Crocinitomicaceae bacterium]|nr:TolC family protein [Crocinitomicaceae bacterium]
MKIQKYIMLIVVLFIGGASIHAQEIFSLEDAIQTALENNHKIKIRRYDAQIKAKQVNPAMVGARPTINANASYEFGWSDASIETLNLASGGEATNTIELDGISNDVIIGAEISMTLLDGKASKYRLEQLGQISQMAQLQIQQTIEQTVASVSNAYLQMAQQQAAIAITQQSIALTNERLKRTKEDASYGTSSSLKYLQIEVDLKTDSATLNNQLLAYANARRSLNQLMGQAPNTIFQVQAEVSSNRFLLLSELLSALRQNSVLLKLNNRNIELANIDVKLSQAAYKPRLQAYANANFTYLQNNANFLQSNTTIGPNVGVRFQYPIFDWGARKIKEESAVMIMEQRRMEQVDTEEYLIKELYNAYATYENTIEQLRIEESNIGLFESNLDNMQNMYQMGTVTNTDVRSAQLNYNAAQNRISNYQYLIKQAEVQLYLLSGQLVN